MGELDEPCTPSLKSNLRMLKSNTLGLWINLSPSDTKVSPMVSVPSSTVASAIDAKVTDRANPFLCELMMTSVCGEEPSANESDRLNVPVFKSTHEWRRRGTNRIVTEVVSHLPLTGRVSDEFVPLAQVPGIVSRALANDV